MRAPNFDRLAGIAAKLEAKSAELRQLVQPLSDKELLAVREIDADVAQMKAD
ncbi:MAG: hypothetical protein ACRDNK_21535 [Solirubrobacteraceae bacterium]